ncbi:MAG: hypothetical protein OXD31_03325 [Chloroflexi bacterium]|nr:hypothetical protein [Chloroflexota bacterium]
MSVSFGRILLQRLDGDNSGMEASPRKPGERIIQLLRRAQKYDSCGVEHPVVVAPEAMPPYTVGV